MSKAELGDIVAVRWRDAFVFKGDKVPKIMEVITWGKLTVENEDGIGVTTSEVQAGGQDVETRMDSQFVLKETVIEIKKL